MHLPALLAAALVVAVVLLVFFALRRGSQPAHRNAASDETHTDPFGSTYELFNLAHRAADHTTPDAIVRVPKIFDAERPLHLVVYNHGFYTDVRGALTEMRLIEQMRNAPVNSILFLPEWQKTPKVASSDQGRFKQQGTFDGMVKDAFERIPSLQGRTFADIGSVSVLAHSAGYAPTESILYSNALTEKVVSVTLLDALYDRNGFDGWLRENIEALAEGRKRFCNIFYGTREYSKAQAQTIKRMLRREEVGREASAILEDYDAGSVVLDTAAIASHPIVFKYSSVSLDGMHPHFTIPHLYVHPCVSADKRIV